MLSHQNLNLGSAVVTKWWRLCPLASSMIEHHVYQVFVAQIASSHGHYWLC